MDGSIASRPTSPSKMKPIKSSFLSGLAYSGSSTGILLNPTLTTESVLNKREHTGSRLILIRSYSADMGTSRMRRDFSQQISRGMGEKTLCKFMSLRGPLWFWPLRVLFKQAWPSIWEVHFLSWQTRPLRSVTWRQMIGEVENVYNI